MAGDKQPNPEAALYGRIAAALATVLLVLAAVGVGNAAGCVGFPRVSAWASASAWLLGLAVLPLVLLRVAEAWKGVGE